MPTGYRRSLFIAAIYPEVCTLAAVVAANRHTVVPIDGRGIERIISATGQALGSVDIGSEISVAVLPRLTTAISGPLLGPAGSYPQTGHHDDGRPRIADGQRQAELGTANRFARDRRAPRPHSRAAPLPYAHRPTTAAVTAGGPH
jgi:hypothetical protein